MTDAVRPSGGASSELRRTIWPWSTEIPLLSADPFNLDARLVIDDEEYIRCTGRDGYTLTGCERGISPEEGGSEAKLWRGGTPVDQVSWTTTEVVTDYPDTPTLAMVGRDFAWDAGDGNIYRYHVVLIEDAPVIIWDDEPPAGATDMVFLWASLITSLTSISGVALDVSGNIYVVYNAVNYRSFTNALALRYFVNELSSGLQHVAADTTSNFLTDSVIRVVGKRLSSTGAAGSPISFGSAGTGNGQFAVASPVGIAFDGTSVWVVDPGNNRVQKFTASTGAYVSQFAVPAGTTGICLGPTSTHLYVLCAGAGEIRKHLKSDHSLVATFTLGNGTADGQISSTAEGIAVDSTGRIWIADTGNHRIQVFDSAGLFLGKVGSFGSGDSQFKSPKQLAVGSGDVIYVADSGNNRLVTLQEDLGITYPLGMYVLFQMRSDNTSGLAESEWTNQAAAAQELFNLTNPAHRKLADLSMATQYDFSVHVQNGGHTTAMLDVEYSTNLVTPSWTSLGGGAVSISSAGWQRTGWVSLPSGAQTVVLLRVMGSGGNGTADPRFFGIAAQFR